MCQLSSMGKTYRPYLPEQDLLLPPSLRDWLPEGHLAYFVSDLIDELNLSAIESHYEQEERGYPPYHPRMMTKILVYGYCVGVFSSRRLQQRLHEDVAFRVLAVDNQPDFRTLSDFRKIHLSTLHGLFEQVLRMALELGALKLGRIAIDGSKLKANASKHKAMSYKRMKEEQKRLKQEVRRLLKEAERIDAEEDARYGRNSYGDELPAELQRREERLQRIRAAKRALEARARQEAEATAKEPDENGSKQEVKPEVKPEEKDQYNFTDPESRILKGPDGFLQGYNAQIAVEPVLQLIVGQAVTQAANDKKQLLPMLATVEHQAGQKPTQVLADSGYTSDASLQGMEKAKVDAYLAVARDKHHQRTEQCPRGPLPKGATRTDRMRRKLQTQVGRAIYAARKAIVEPVFGQIKQARGFRQFLLRGLEKAQGEWALVCMAHNILKLHRLVST
jgi:transposase/IS5 family transposase